MLRRLARSGLRQFIYRSVGYDPKIVLPHGWREYRDRLILNTHPPGVRVNGGDYDARGRAEPRFLTQLIETDSLLWSEGALDAVTSRSWGSE